MKNTFPTSEPVEPARQIRFRGTASLLCAIFCLLAVFAGGCGHVDRSRSVIVWEQMDPKEQEFFDLHVTQFQAQHPEYADFTIERVHYRTEDLQTQFQTAALAFAGPNLVYGPADKIGPYSIMGLVMPVEDLLPQSEIERFDPVSLPILNGHTYGLPDHVGNQLTLVANLDLVGEIATNTDDWLQQLLALTIDKDGDGKNEQYGLVFNLLEPFWLVPWLGGFGGWVMDDNSTPTLDSNAMVGALTFLKDLKTRGVVPGECDYPLADTLFKEGRAAYIINGPWSWQGYRDNGINVGLASIPRVSTTDLWPTPATSAKCYSINAHLDPATRECTAALLKWLTGTEVQIALANGLSVMPADKAAARNPSIQNDPALVASRQQIERGRLMPIVPEMRAIWDAMRPAYQSVMNGAMTPADAARSMQDRATTQIERMRE